MLNAGEEREAILKQTGCAVGIADVSFDVYAGEILVVMGLSGSGKSTLIRCVNRLIEPTAGEIIVDGTDISRLDREALRAFRRDKFGMGFHNFALFPHRSVQRNVEYGLEIRGTERAARAGLAREALKLVGLEGWENARDDRAYRLIMPVLDFMQTMPAFVYLIPAIPFFGLGAVSAIFATVIFAMPPAIRLTTLGIKQTPKELIEAADSFGFTRRQKLFKVQLPVAAPTIMAGVNQTIMLSPWW